MVLDIVVWWYQLLMRNGLSMGRVRWVGLRDINLGNIQVSSLKGKYKEMVHFITLILMFMLENLCIIKPTDTVSIYAKVEINMKVTGLMINHMVMGSKHYRMVFLMDNFTTVWNMDMVFLNIAIIRFIKVTGKITCSTEMENMFGVMAEFTKDNGKMIKCKAKAKYYMKMDVFIKDNSIIISSMVMVY